MFWYMCELCACSAFKHGYSLAGNYAGNRVICKSCRDDLTHELFFKIRSKYVLNKATTNWEKQIAQDCLDNPPSNLTARVELMKIYQKYSFQR